MFYSLARKMNEIHSFFLRFSALFRHEIAFVLGQVASPVAVQVKTLNPVRQPMAIGAISNVCTGSTC